MSNAYAAKIRAYHDNVVDCHHVANANELTEVNEGWRKLEMARESGMREATR